MGQTKKIQINAAYLTSHEGGRMKKRKEKPKVKHYITPNKVKRALMDRIKEHQHKQKQQKEGGKNKPDNVFATDFKKTLTYLDSVVNKNQTMKRQRKHRRRKRKEVRPKIEPPIHTKISNQDDPPYGILKGGKKPLYSEYKKTLRKKPSSIVLPPEVTIVTPTPPIIERQKKLDLLRKKIKTPTRKRRLKRYTLGKRGGRRCVGVLIKSRKTRRKIKKEHNNLKKKPIAEIKLYLKKHGLLKIGSKCPEKVMREIYETAMLTGDVYNKSGEVLYHNFVNS